MDNRWTPTPQDATRAVAVFYYAADETYDTILSGTATLLADLTPYVSRATQTNNDLTVTFSFFSELYGADQPRPGQMIALQENGRFLWIGLIDAVSDYREQTGTRTLSVTSRKRDAVPAWREFPRITNEYPQGTRLDVIATDVAAFMGLLPQEIQIPSIGYNTPGFSTQLSQLPAWRMLELLLIVGGYSPLMDTIGRLKAVNREVLRASDIVLTEERVLAVTGSRSGTKLSRLQLKWREAELTRVEQQDRALGQATITAGFFQLRQRQDVYFSEDRTQRAANTRMIVKQSANSGLLPICDEEYAPFRAVHLDEIVGGRITLETYAYVPALLAIVIGVKALSFIPDGVVVGGIGASTGVTIPIGRPIQAAADVIALLTLASIGTGVYEIWGTPFEYVQSVNTTEAYNPLTPEWAEKADVIESDFVPNEAQAQAIVTREFLYRSLSTDSYSVTIVDDLRVEEGDIIELPDGSRIYVTGFNRDLSHGAAAVLNVSGFMV